MLVPLKLRLALSWSGVCDVGRLVVSHSSDIVNCRI